MFDKRNVWIRSKRTDSNFWKIFKSLLFADVWRENTEESKKRTKEAKVKKTGNVKTETGTWRDEKMLILWKAIERSGKLKMQCTEWNIECVKRKHRREKVGSLKYSFEKKLDFSKPHEHSSRVYHRFSKERPDQCTGNKSFWNKGAGQKSPPKQSKRKTVIQELRNQTWTAKPENAAEWKSKDRNKAKGNAWKT